ncbi:MAG TPA: HSP18 transcriptional regulator [Actinophytocola sp.]|nr:HSP18 transcriptional regulator [Actinophytocola sp.]
MADPEPTLRDVHAALRAARTGAVDRESFLAALTALRLLREELSTWEPELIGAARAAGASWALLAPALGVASRQAAERRYLRLQPSETGERTGEGRVDARRDQRAGDRAVAQWARENSGTLRKLAGQISALDEVDSADQVGTALDSDDAATLVDPLTASRPHLTANHPDLAAQLDTIADHTAILRRDAAHRRHSPHDGQD